ncbi:dihydroorotase [Ameyamaea chiangmaiensis NBRC 103196]|uniref:Amidohydrolase family protein n=1 Tax=Ameyamaea chiangmaiensis TaxID=442969 RepID=A0A850P4R4_9PROT|nr:amidohydrolase family protein [Ameyamaea chiangmaiensis]MBS4076120.1 amidohydrolase family protein [Ameyamaea chiangmaiensis]NVN39635.1 amidohydrolase family protein [Ameyamaea chiangmaiensis]GBQ67092.1 dihydroorotase [Ameyamaea chiangmaiensis NBRC 103196]
MDRIILGRIVTPSDIIENGWIGIRDGVIAAIGQGPAPSALDVVDATGSYVMPGVVDGQTHAGSYAGLAGLESTTRSAIAGGVTTIVDMPYDNPEPLSTVERLREKVAAIETLAHCDVALYGTVMPGQGTADMAPLIDGGVVAFKISSFESSPTRFPRIAADQTSDILAALAETDIPLGLHNEDQEMVRSGIAAARAAGRDGIEAHSDSRPIAAEMTASAAFFELGAAHGAHAHIVHFTTARGMELADQYQALGYRATGETCVHYLVLDPQEHGPALGARMKVNPPIRPGARDGLWNEILHERVAFVSSDHSSWPIDNKFTPSIFDAGAGVPGLETLLPAFFTEAERRGYDAPALTAAQLSERPAKFFGLWPQKGGLCVGADADIAIFTPGEHVWDSAAAHDDLKWSPFDGHRFTGRVSRTYLRGETAWDGSDVVNRPGAGEYVRRGLWHWFA